MSFNVYTAPARQQNTAKPIPARVSSAGLVSSFANTIGARTKAFLPTSWLGRRVRNSPPIRQSALPFLTSERTGMPENEPETATGAQPTQRPWRWPSFAPKSQKVPDMRDPPSFFCARASIYGDDVGGLS